MKTIKLFMSALLITGLMSTTSCSSDDDGGSQTGGDLTARWNPTKTVTKVGNGDDESTPYGDNDPDCNKNYVEFMENGTVRIVAFTSPFDECQEFVDAEATTYTRTENMLTIVGNDNYDGVYEIIRLTNSELRIREETNAGGVTITTTIFFTKASNQG